MEEPDILIEFLDCEKIWKQITPIEQNFASDLSCLIWENDENSLDEMAADSRFTNLQRMGILLISDNGPKFVSHFMFYYALCQYQISSNSFIAKSTPDILTDMKRLRQDFSDHTFKDYQNVLSYIFIVLINNYQRHDIILDLASDTITNDEYWFFFESINIAIPLLDLNAKDFVTFLVGVSERIGRDLASGSFYRAVYKLGYRKPAFALDLIDKYISLGNWQAVAILEHLLLGTSAVSSEYLKKSIRLGEEWVNSEIEKLQQVGLYYLLDLSLEEKYEPTKFISLGKYSLTEPKDPIPSTLANCLVRLGIKFLHLANESFELLKVLKIPSNIGEVNHGIALALADRNPTYSDFFKNCLYLLIDTPIENKGTIQEINHVLFPFTTSDPLMVWKFLETWILNHDRIEFIVEHDLFLVSIQYAFKANIELGNSILAKWFVSNDNKLVEEARKIIAEFGVIDFSKEIIKNLSEKETIYIVEKLLIGQFDSHQIFHLFHSIVNNTNHFTLLRNYFLDSLAYLTVIYPGASRDIIENYMGKDEISPTRDLISDVVSNFAEYQEKVKTTRHLIRDELPGSKIRLRKFREFQSKKMESISRAVSESDRFPLQKLISKIMIGRGDRSFYMNVFDLDPNNRRTFSAPRNFAKFSQTFELPISELIDPEGEILRRLERLHLKIEDIQVNNE